MTVMADMISPEEQEKEKKNWVMMGRPLAQHRNDFATHEGRPLFWIAAYSSE